MTIPASPVLLEVAFNGATRAFQPRIPVTIDAIVDDALACADLGAAVIHLHAYSDKGEAVEDADIYSRIIERIRAKTTAIIYPTLALSGDLETRFRPIRALSERGLLEMGVVDPGSVNIPHKTQAAAG
ncbi:MAG TPA: 3-keto-5-aminohexanoate cleavage protein, partial [Parvularculaceae bacterium]|nr:3-keto-5-aminohexanoate cleavage protein [Parvularculaceae bacterium]